jgi:hypothetical protein
MNGYLLCFFLVSLSPIFAMASSPVVVSDAMLVPAPTITYGQYLETLSKGASVEGWNLHQDNLSHWLQKPKIERALRREHINKLPLFPFVEHAFEHDGKMCCLFFLPITNSLTNVESLSLYLCKDISEEEVKTLSKVTNEDTLSYILRILSWKESYKHLKAK